ncbi:MAG TPA: ABC transporter permease, partial [Chitinophagaceae bacterium]|nr:ABC transporter permease [Chitinophagaceae bacterium]
QAIDWTAIFYFPAGIFVVVFSAFGLGTFLAALNVKFRDFRYTLPFLMQLLFFASQIIYPLTAVKQSWLHYLLAVNPMNAGIELFRSPLYHTSPDMQVVGIGLASALLLFITGLIYFRKTEAYFADIS